MKAFCTNLRSGAIFVPPSLRKRETKTERASPWENKNDADTGPDHRLFFTRVDKSWAKTKV